MEQETHLVIFQIPELVWFLFFLSGLISTLDELHRGLPSNTEMWGSTPRLAKVFFLF